MTDNLSDKPSGVRPESDPELRRSLVAASGDASGRRPVRRRRLDLPFDNRREDAGTWAYDHRIGLCVTLIAYLVLMIVFVSSKIVVGRRASTQGMYIDLQTLAELERERDRLEEQTRQRQMQDPIDWRSIRNAASNENALNEALEDDRGTNASLTRLPPRLRIGCGPIVRPMNKVWLRSRRFSVARGPRRAPSVRTARSREGLRCHFR